MGRDTISKLPDFLLMQILSYLPTKDSVRTSVLSKRWEFLWRMVPVLDIYLDDFLDCSEDLEIFVDKFLAFNRELRMQKFKIGGDEECDIDFSPDRFREWISITVDLKIQHLDVQVYDVPYFIQFRMPQNIYKSDTLVSLYLETVWMEDPQCVVSLPCLKIMRLDNVWYDDDPLIMEKLISGCPVLEDLTLIRPSEFYNQEVLFSLRVRSQSLKRFRFTFENNEGGTDFSVEIDAPRLEYLSFKDNQSDKILLKNLSSLFMVDIHSEFNVMYGGSPLDPEDLTKRDTILGFLTGISSVRHMIISECTIEVLYRYSELGTIPKFDNLYRLEAAFSSSVLRFLPVFLESCPNLKNLIIDFAVSVEQEQSKLTYVPPCLSLNLEYVEIKGLTVKEDTWKQLAKYFLKNSAVLKKLVPGFKDSVIYNEDSDVSKEFLTYPKLSCKCQIITC